MPVYEKNGLTLFIDGMPDEQVVSNPELVMCLVGIISVDRLGVPGLKQYKDVPARDRPEIAQNLAQQIRNDALEVFGIATCAHSSEVARYGEKFLSILPKGVVKPVNEKRIRVGKEKLGLNVSLVIPWYAVSLVCMGLRTAIWARQINESRVSIILDLLPSAPSTAMKLLQLISYHPELSQLWEETMTKFSVDFQFGNMNTFTTLDGSKYSAKDHPGLILADWFSHSVFAACNSAHTLDGSVGRSEEYRRALTAPFFALHEKKKINVIPLNKLVVSEESSTVDAAELLKNLSLLSDF